MSNILRDGKFKTITICNHSLNFYIEQNDIFIKQNLITLLPLWIHSIKVLV